MWQESAPTQVFTCTTGSAQKRNRQKNIFKKKTESTWKAQLYGLTEWHLCFGLIVQQLMQAHCHL